MRAREEARATCAAEESRAAQPRAKRGIEEVDASPRSGQVELSVYNVLGQRIRRLVGDDLPAGQHRVRWDGRDADGRNAASGVYLIAAHMAGWRSAQQVLLLR